MLGSERITVECPRCGATYDAWPMATPVLDLDPELGDPGFIEAQAAATCPSCGATCCCTGLAGDPRGHPT